MNHISHTGDHTSYVIHHVNVRHISAHRARSPARGSVCDSDSNSMHEAFPATLEDTKSGTF